MSVDPTVLTPKTGAGLPVAGSPVASLLRPAVNDLLAGTVPTLPTWTQPTAWTTIQSYFVRQQPTHTLIGGTVFVIGDSIHQGQPMQLYSPFAEGYNIGGDTIEGVLNRIGAYTGMRSGRATILNIGVNNLSGSITLNGVTSTQAAVQAQMQNLLNWITGPLVWIKVLPTGISASNTQINIFNTAIMTFLSGRAKLATVDMTSNLAMVDGSGILLPANTIDGIHLSAAGFANVLAPAVRAALATI